ncbi:hemicentin-1-like isoform X6 [Mytilus trossulus]|uniref:hemicentin-1-like isoform X6 n=1 Tax=Mytilus trossulus TaxID=6551 RepID=UPI00300714BF
MVCTTKMVLPLVVLIGIFLQPSYAQVPAVSLTQTSYSVNAGGQITLGCSVTLSSALNQVFWQRNVNGFVSTITSNTNTNKYSGSSTSVPSLTILNTDNSDQGTYQCFASNAFGTGQSSTIAALTVSTPGTPTVAIQQTSYSVNNGGSITLSCTVSSATSVTWQRTVGTSVTTITSTTNTNKYSGSTPSTPSLTIFNADSSDAGTYRCLASNNVGTAQSSSATTLTVITNTVPSVTITQTFYSVNSGSTVTLACTVSSTTTVTGVSWQRTVNGVISTITSNTNTNKYSGSTSSVPSLTIFNTDSSDAGTYRCFASNSAGTGQSGQTASLTVTPNTVPSVTITQTFYSVNSGSTVTLACTVSSTTTVTGVTWQRTVNGFITSITSTTNTNKYSGSTSSVPSLTIFNTDSSDAGTYRCLASNSAGTGQSDQTASLTVTTNTVPSVTITQTFYSVNSGSTVTLACTVSSTTTVTGVTWQRTVNGFITSITSTTNTNKYSGSTSSVPSLTIFNTDSSDAGTYRCLASNSAGTGQSGQTASLTVTTNNSPTVTILNDAINVVQGNSVTLDCTVSSNLALTSVYWQRNTNGAITTINPTVNNPNNKYSGSTTSNPALSISNADIVDAGDYTCFAVSSAGTGQSNIVTRLTVLAQSVPTVAVQQPSYSVTTGGSVTLSCTVTSNLAVTDVFWQSNIGGSTSTIRSTTNTNKYSGSTTGTPSLTIFNVAQSDVGTYTCFATNSVGTGQSTNTQLSVTGTVPTVQIQQPSYSALTGNIVTLVCSVTSNFAVTNVYWQRNVGGTIATISASTNTNKYGGSSSATPSLTIFNAAQSDVGTYTCFATNSVGTGQSTTTQLSVTGTVPTVQVQQSSYSVNTGSSITLGCTVTSNLAVTDVYWQRNIGGSILTIRSTTNTNKYSGITTGTPSLTIFNADQNDVATYTCFASNSVGTGQSTNTQLSVTGTVPTVQVQQSSYSVNTGSSITLGCTVTSNLAVTDVYWQRNIGGSILTIRSTTNTNKYSGITTGTPSLTIFNADQNDVATYTCFASNSVGTGQSTNTQLSVTGTVPTVQVQQPSYSVTTGGSVTLVCTVSSNLAVTDVYWQRNVGSSILTIRSTTNTNKYSGITTGTPSLTILNADQNDVATYTCFASNSVGTGQSTTTQLSVTGTVPTVQVQQPSYSVTTGSSVTLVCTVTSTLTVNNVYWQRSINGGGTTQISTNTNKYSGSIPSTPSLTIFNADQNDVATYTCFATNSVGTGQSSTTTLSVTGSVPTVQVQQPSYSVTTGNTVTLVCTVSSNLAVTDVYWQRNVGSSTSIIRSTTNTNKYSGITTGTPSLTIFNAAQSDVGTYTCFATNSVGTGQSTTTQLSVTGTVPTVQVQQPSYSVTTGNTVTLGCTVTSNLAVTDVYWQRNIGSSTSTIRSTTNTNKYSGITTGTPSLTIFNADQSDVGTYTCFASNSVGTGQSTNTQLSVTGTVPTVQVQQPSYSVTTGSSVTLVCTVTSTLTVNNVYWQRNNGGGTTQISTNTNKYSGSIPGTPSLTIFNADQSDVGTYTCFATNSVGTGQSTTTTLSVTGTVPTVQVQQPSYSVTTGSSVTLVCTVTSTLTVNNVYWQRNNGGGTTQISTNTNKYSGSIPGTPSLTIFNADQSDVGTYTCFATNSVGTGQSTTTTLSVTGTPPTVIVPQPSYSITIGDSITFVCNVTSNLPVTSVQWERNIGGSVTTITSTTNTNKYSGSTPTTPSLTIFNGAQSDSGDYTCYATNSVGTGQSTVTTLSVTGTPPTVTVLQPAYSITVGDSVTLECTVTSVLPVTSVQWQRNVGGIITTITSTSNTNKYSGNTVTTPSLTISVTALSDTGDYTCFATNSVGSGQSTVTTLTVTGTPPTVTVLQPSYSITVGDSVTLECTVTSVLPVTSVQWQRNVGGIITTITSTSNTNKYSGNTVTTPSLTISVTALSDTGDYTCFATNSVGTGQSTVTTLTVTGTPPTVTVLQPSYSITVGNSVTLECTVSSVLPVTSVQWQRNVGGIITTITSTSNTNKYSGNTVTIPSLTISVTALSDTGDYTCFATNSVGSGQSTVTTLTVTGTPPTVTVLQPSYSITVGNSVTLECTVSSVLPVTSVQWQRNVGGIITTITSTSNTNKYSGNTVTIPSLTISVTALSDTGDYTCFATNSVGSGQSTVTTLTVTGTPPTVTVLQPSYSITVGNSVTLECTVSSVLPVTSVQWQRNVGGIITTITSTSNTNKYSGNTVTIPSLTISVTALSDTGDYTCFATNSVGSGQSTVTTLTVTGTPPTVTVLQPSYSITVGNSVTLECTVSSVLPVTSVQWQRNVGGIITTITSTSNTNKYSGNTVTTPSLTISVTALSDTGDYTCFATNSVGSGQSTVTTLTVTGTPPTVTVQQPTYSVTTGNSITLGCTVTSNLAVITVYWQRNINNVQTTITTTNNKYSGSSVSQPSLTIFNAAQSDAGVYTCFATNSVGTGQSTTTSLAVTGSIPVVTVSQPNYNVVIGNTVTLECTVSANPFQTSVSWQKIQNGVTNNVNTGLVVKYSGSTVNNPSLTITNTDTTDSANYVCTATNSVGTGTSSQTSLSVTGSIPVVQIPQPSYTVNLAQTITITCTVTSNPTHTSVQWQRTQNGVTTNIGVGSGKYSGGSVNSPSLSINNADLNDIGQYVCSATNIVGTGTSTATTLNVVGDPPSVVVQQPSYSVLVGNTITLVCTVTSTPAATSVVWQRTTNGVTTTISLANANKYSGSSVNVPSLTIFSSAESDEGSYVCRATNQFGTGQSTATTLTVTGSIPVVQILQSTYQVNFGSSRVLECTVSSNPAHSTVQWQKLVNNQFQPINFANNKYEGSSVSIPSLTVNSADLNDEGFYICTATNSLGIGQSSQTFLDVIGNILTVTIQQSQYSVTIGQTVTLGCTVTGSPAATNVYWQKTVNNVVTTISSNTNTNKYSGSIVSTPSLTIFNADQSDEATYVCFATNGVGLGQSTQTFLDVTGNAPSVQVQQPQYNSNFGSTVTLVCTVTANPAHTTVQWQRVINSQRSNINVGLAKYTGSTVGTPSLTINNVELSDEGNYVCTATNSIGTGESTQTFLDVVGNTLTVQIPQSTYSVLLGQSRTLECLVSGSPSATSVYWQKIQGSTTTTINSNTNTNKYSGGTVGTPSLTVLNAVQNDEANYICYAVNAVGTGNSQQTFLDVTGNVPSVVIGQAQYTVLISNTVTLGCTVTANPSHTTVYWKRVINGALTDITVTNNNKYSGSTVSSPSLTIFNADNSDEGNYICYADNSVGTGQSSQTFLDVFGNVPVVTVSSSSYSINLNNPVTLGCTVTANPVETSVFWQKIKNGVTTTINFNTNTNKYGGSSVQNPSLQIFSVVDDDEATYVCFAVNSVGTGQSSQTTLTVIGSIPSVVIPQNQYQVNIGNTITLQCQVTATPQHTVVEWRRTINGVTNTISVTNTNKYSGSTVATPSLTISTSASSDEGFYTCYATNSIGTGNSQQTYLDVVGTRPTVTVLSNQYTVILGNTVTLECQVVATPQHTSVQWTRLVNGQTTNINMGTGNNKYSGSTVNGPSLTISAAANSDEGYYICTATNIAGTGSSQQTYLDVTGNLPNVVVTLQQYNVDIGSTVTLGCTVTASPTHTVVYWQRIGNNNVGTTVDMNNNKYSGSTVNSPSLTINNAALSDEGSYRCYATNSIGLGQSQNTFLDVVGNTPVVTVLSNQYSVNIGASRTLECTVTASPTHDNVYWQRNINGVSTTITVNNNKYSGSTVSNPSLTINNADNNDEGFYICFATNSVGLGQSANTFLDVLGSTPSVVVPQPTYSVNFGGTVTLTCTISANPAHTSVYWQKVVNGVSQPVTIGNRYTGSTVSSPSLTISSAVQNDEGFYVCYAVNSVGTGNSQQTFLDVQGNIPVVQVQQNTYNVQVGNVVTLQCTVTANPTHTSVQWQRLVNGQTTTINLGSVGKYSGSSVNTPSLTINNAANSDEGYYICQATNSVGTGQSSQTYLDVTGSVLTVVVAQLQYSVNYGNAITLVCSVSGSPSATSVYWQKLKNGQTTTINSNTNTNKYSGSSTQNPSLTINNADDTDSATYTCFAVNSIGLANSQQTSLSVVGNLPIATIGSNQYAIIVGGSVTLGCSVSGNPAVTSVQWTREVNGQNQNIVISGNNRYSGGSVNSPSLVISNVANSDEGYYRCSATNIVGTGVSQQTFLDITGSIPIVTVQQSQYSVTVGNSVTLTCTVTSNPAHTSVKWVKTLNNANNDVEVTGRFSGATVNGPSLTISNSVNSDGGYYTCYATNSIGTGQSQSTFLNVIGNAPQVNILAPTYSVNVGSSVTLQCSVSANPIHTSVYWKKIVNGVAQDINVGTSNNKYGGSTVSSPSLTISNAVVADEGFYVCFAENSVGTGQSSQTFLDVIGNAPIVNVLQISYSINIGSAITLGCTVTSNPAHTRVFWQRIVNGAAQEITVTNTNKYSGSTLNTPSLTITGTTAADAGSYRCLAENSVGTGQSQITVLNVAGNVPTVVLTQTSYTVGYGDTLVIGCTVTSSPAHTSVYWQRISGNGVTQTITVQNNNKYSGSTVQTPSLTILTADGNDVGEYICFATNSVGTGQSSRGAVAVTGAAPTVRVLQSSYSVQRGNPITLECEVTSSPTHTSVYWTRIVNSNTVTLTMTGAKYGGSTIPSPSLIIFNVEDSDEGAYICHATNGIGAGQSSQTFLNVEGYVPSVLASIKPTVNVGESVVINCIVTADPKETTITWQKVVNNVPTTLSITSNNRYSGGTVSTPALTISNVEDNDEGQYICQATNTVGTGSSNRVYLDVVGEPPRLTYVTPSRITVTEGDLILATCVSTANPTPTYTWYKDNSVQAFATGDKLRIEISARTDMGTYTCRARNNYGLDEAALTVDVQYKPDVTISTSTSTFNGVGGGSVNIPCTHLANPAVTAVSWRKVSGGVTETISVGGNKYAGGGLFQSGLTIYNLQASDVGTYQCLATNLVGTGESEIVTLNVNTQAAPFDVRINPVYVDVIAGASFDATCTSKGDPAPTFAWYYSDRMIQTGPQLTVTSTVSTDGGLYTCVATNSQGMAQASMDANVRFAPISTVTTTEFKRTLGDPVTLHCSTRSNPAATEWSWTKDGTTLLNHYSDTFLVDMDSLQDVGTYTCMAKNTVGQSSLIEFYVKEGVRSTVVTVESSEKLTAAEIAAVVVGILLAIAITAVIIICCFTRGLCARKASPRMIEEVPVQRPMTTVKDPIYFKDINLQMVPQYKTIEYVQQEPQYLQYDNPRMAQTQYLPAVEYMPDYDEERRRRRKKNRKAEQVVLEERVVSGGDVYQTTNGGSSVYRTVDRSGDVYIDTTQ